MERELTGERGLLYNQQPTFEIPRDSRGRIRWSKII